MFLYIFVLCFLAALAVSWLGLFLIFCGAKLFRSPVARPAGKILAWFSGPVFLIGALIWWGIFPPATVAYQRVFGESPSSDVAQIQSHANVGHDGEESLLRFQAAPQTIQRLANAQRLPPVALSQFDNYNLGGLDKPEWWQPSITSNWQLYALEPKNGIYNNERVGIFSGRVSIL